MLNVLSNIPEVLSLVWQMLVPDLDVKPDLHNTSGPDRGVQDISPFNYGRNKKIECIRSSTIDGLTLL
jgi:hypothetical protein